MSVIHEYIKLAEDIFGPSVSILKCKKVCTKPKLVEDNIKGVPHVILGRYKKVTLGADVMFSNKIRLFVTIYEQIQFGTVEAVTKDKATTIINCL